MNKDRPHQHLYNRKWQRMSRLFKVHNPLCVYCLNKRCSDCRAQISVHDTHCPKCNSRNYSVDKTTAVEGRFGVVDHIIPHNGDLELFWDQDNWQVLCNACHDGPKRLEEARGYAIGCDSSGLPLDKNHDWNK